MIIILHILFLTKGTTGNAEIDALKRILGIPILVAGSQTRGGSQGRFGQGGGGFQVNVGDYQYPYGGRILGREFGWRSSGSPGRTAVAAVVVIGVLVVKAAKTAGAVVKVVRKVAHAFAHALEDAGGGFLRSLGKKGVGGWLGSDDGRGHVG